LFEVGQAGRLSCFFTCLCEDREEDRGKNGDDSDNNEQLNQRKSFGEGVAFTGDEASPLASRTTCHCLAPWAGFSLLPVIVM
jgi:hypothetical protein